MSAKMVHAGCFLLVIFIDVRHDIFVVCVMECMHKQLGPLCSSEGVGKISLVV